MDLRYGIEVQNALILLCLCVTAITSEDTRFARSIANHERQSSLSSSYGKDTQLHIRKKRGFLQFLTEDYNARANKVPEPSVSDFSTGSETSSGSGSQTSKKSSGRSSQTTRGSGSRVPGRIISETRSRGSRPRTTRTQNKGEVRRSRMRGPHERRRRLGNRGSHIGVHQSSGGILRGQGMGVHGPRNRGPHDTGTGGDRHGITMGDDRGPSIGDPYSPEIRGPYGGGMGRRPRIGGPSGPETRGPEIHGPEEPRGGMYRGREMGGGHRHRMGEYPGSQMGDTYGRGMRRPNNLGIGVHDPRIPGVEGIPASPSLGGYVPGIGGIQGPMGGLFDGTSVGGAISGPGMGGAYRPEERIVDRPGRGGTHRRRRRRFRG